MVGVSPSTISRVFSNPESVAKTTVKRVLELAENVGFSPNIVAKAAFGESTKSIGVILPLFTDHFYGTLAETIQNTLIENNYLPIFLTVNKTAEDPMKRLLQHNVDALILATSDERLNIPAICKKQLARLPIIVVDNIHPGFYSDLILNDDRYGGQLAGEHLARLGHTKFGVCIYGEENSNSRTRLRGFEDALREQGITSENITTLSLGFHKTVDIELGKLKVQIKELLSSVERPTAFFCAKDPLAFLVYETAFELGIKIPEDLSVIGFGNSNFGPYCTPPLTTINQHPEIIGKKAVELVLKRLQDPAAPIEEFRIPVELTTRKSTCLSR